MASETDQVSENATFERLIRQRGLQLFLPFVLGFREHENTRNQTQEGEATPPQPVSDRIILVNPFTQGMVVIEGTSSLDALLHEFGSRKDGQPPASRSSIEAMESVEIEGDGEECVVCLEEWQPGGVAKVMPCEHKFHGECIEKWLRIHGSCPVCRYNMPVDEEYGKMKDDQDGRRVGREVWVSFVYNGVRRSGDSDQNNTLNTPSGDSNESMSTTNSGPDTES